MAVSVICPSCRSRLAADESSAGQLIHCPLCGGAVRLGGRRPQPSANFEPPPQFNFQAWGLFAGIAIALVVVAIVIFFVVRAAKRHSGGPLAGLAEIGEEWPPGDSEGIHASRHPPNKIVTVRLAGVEGPIWNVAYDRLVQLSANHREEWGAASSERAGPGRWVMTFGAIGDAEGFARSFDFGKVRHVRGRIITVDVTQVDMTPVGDANKPRTPVTITPERLAQLLDDLKSKSTFRRGAAARAISGDVAPKQREELGRVLNERVRESDVFVSRPAIVALGKLRYVPAADAIASRLHHEKLRDDAFDALTEYGTLAESALVKHLVPRDADDEKSIIRACELLEKFGTAASLGPLRELALSDNRRCAPAAGSAMRAIKRRERIE